MYGALWVSQEVLVVKKPPADAGDTQEMWVWSLGWRSLEEAWQPALVFLPGESHGQRSLVNYNPQGCKELDMNEATYQTTHMVL